MAAAGSRGRGRRAGPWQVPRRPSPSPSRIRAHAAAAASPRPGLRGRWNSGTSSAPSDTCRRCCCSSWPTVSAGTLLPGGSGILSRATRASLPRSPQQRSRKKRGRLHGLEPSPRAARASGVGGTEQRSVATAARPGHSERDRGSSCGEATCRTRELARPSPARVMRWARARSVSRSWRPGRPGGSSLRR